MSAARDKVRAVIRARCTALTPAEQLDLERGIFNFTLEDAKRRSVRRVWENPESVSYTHLTLPTIYSV